MTRDQIDRVQATWALLTPVADMVAAQFYERLFELDPSLRVLFVRIDADVQRRKFANTLAVVVAGLGQFANLLPAIDALARRHTASGVADRHYATVGRALLETIGCVLGADFDDRTREAWARAYAQLAGAMMAAGSRPRAHVRDAADVDSARASAIAAPQAGR
jgi:nitric oxide dioxygenase